MRRTKGPRVVFTTANAIVQRVPDRAERRGAGAVGRARQRRPDGAASARWLEANGFDRTATVREVGEYAVRGGILDLWAPGAETPIRLDFFGDTLETIRPFDPESQRTTGQLTRLELVPASEAMLTEETISRFRQNYRAAFGAVLGNDPLYEAVSEGRRFAGMEHWLPFFYEKLETLFDYLPDVPVIVGHLVEEALADRLEQVRDHFEARKEAVGEGRVRRLRALQADPARRALSHRRRMAREARRRAGTRGSAPSSSRRRRAPAIDIGGRTGRSFAAERAAGDVNVFDALVEPRRQPAKNPGERSCSPPGARARATASARC